MLDHKAMECLKPTFTSVNGGGSQPTFCGAKTTGSGAGGLSDPSLIAIQPIDIKKRKRQFANRTKTGCSICRKRKKKCDEAKPRCYNCKRGGYVCEGYASTPLLQAKEHIRNTAYQSRLMVPHYEPAYSNSQPYLSPGACNGAKGTCVQPIVIEEQGRRLPTPSSNGRKGALRGSDSKHTAAATAHYSQLLATSPDGRAPLLDHHMLQPLRSPPSQQHPPQYNPRVYRYTPPSLNQVADSHHQAPQQPRQPPILSLNSAPPAPPQTHDVPQPESHKTEKEKMLQEEPFFQYDEQLMKERYQCTFAVYNFNSTACPSVIIARGDRERHFKRIIAAAWIRPRHAYYRSGVHVGGHLGGNVNVITPFHCDYGYNLSIGDNVNIGPHCHLLDSARIVIGKNTKIGALVTISTLKTPSDTKSLKGSNGTEIAREVSIGENVHIGNGVTIEAGVSIGDSAIIIAGSVIVHDIAPGVTAHGNPALG